MRCTSLWTAYSNGTQIINEDSNKILIFGRVSLPFPPRIGDIMELGISELKYKLILTLKKYFTLNVEERLFKNMYLAIVRYLRGMLLMQYFLKTTLI